MKPPRHKQTQINRTCCRLSAQLIVSNLFANTTATEQHSLHFTLLHFALFHFALSRGSRRRLARCLLQQLCVYLRPRYLHVAHGASADKAVLDRHLHKQHSHDVKDRVVEEVRLWEGGASGGTKNNRVHGVPAVGGSPHPPPSHPPTSHSGTDPHSAGYQPTASRSSAPPPPASRPGF